MKILTLLIYLLLSLPTTMENGDIAGAAPEPDADVIAVIIVQDGLIWFPDFMALGNF